MHNLVITHFFLITNQVDKTSTELVSNANSNLLNLDDKVELSSGNDAKSELSNNARVRSTDKVGSALDDEAIKILENEEITGYTHVIYVTSPNQIDFLENIIKDATNLLNLNKKNQSKGKKKH